jgi:hypothetical protein
MNSEFEQDQVHLHCILDVVVIEHPLQMLLRLCDILALLIHAITQEVAEEWLSIVA